MIIKPSRYFPIMRGVDPEPYMTIVVNENGLIAPIIARNRF